MEPISFKTDWLGKLDDSEDPAKPGPILPDQGDHEWWLFDLISRYLQPGSSIPQSDVVDKALEIYSGYNDLVVRPCIYHAAEQIPYWHNAHKTLAELVVAIDDDPRRLQKATSVEPILRENEFMTLMMHQISDWQDSPMARVNDGMDARGFPNFRAWLANMMNVGNRLHGEYYFSIDMTEAIYQEDLDKGDLDMRSLWIIGAAQWFMPDVIDSAWRAWRDPYEVSGDLPTVMWSDWAAKFHDVSQKSAAFYTEECRAVAAEAARTMREKIMSSGDPGDDSLDIDPRASS